MQHYESTSSTTSPDIPVSFLSVSPSNDTHSESNTANKLQGPTPSTSPSYIDTLASNCSRADASGTPSYDEATLRAIQSAASNTSLASAQLAPFNFDFGSDPFPLFTSEMGQHAATDPGHYDYAAVATLEDSMTLPPTSASDLGHSYTFSRSSQARQDEEQRPRFTLQLDNANAFAPAHSQTSQEELGNRPPHRVAQPSMQLPEAQRAIRTSSALHESKSNYGYTNSASETNRNNRLTSSPNSDRGEHGHDIGIPSNDLGVSMQEQARGDASIDFYTAGHGTSEVDDMDAEDSCKASTNYEGDRAEDLGGQASSKERGKGKSRTGATSTGSSSKEPSYEQRIRNRQSSQRHRLKMKQRADENERKVRYLEVKVRQLEQELYQYRQSGPAGQHDVLMEENQILRQNVHILEQELCRWQNLANLSASNIADQRHTDHAGASQGYISASGHSSSSALRAPMVSLPSSDPAGHLQAPPRQNLTQQLINNAYTTQSRPDIPDTPGMMQYVPAGLDSLPGDAWDPLSAPTSAHPMAASSTARPGNAATDMASASTDGNRVYINPYAFGHAVTPRSVNLPKSERSQPDASSWQRQIGQPIAIQPAPLLRRQRSTAHEAASSHSRSRSSNSTMRAAALLDMEEMARADYATNEIAEGQAR
ncbi:hypothetical protein P389DRAFT_9494 [Cystobasidium minutum MCA 4210]|uniref:uncharacterized protein n=1 Tax=Cystobasidium minutum MCA 4210 TaxID=1397322 RepID=UPI0034CF2261|eukprot:jgi/Rhomi1/9494/CE9493_216